MATTSTTNGTVHVLTLNVQVIDLDGIRLNKNIYNQLDTISPANHNDFEPVGRINGLSTYYMSGELHLIGTHTPTGQPRTMWLSPDNPHYPLLAPTYQALPLIILGAGK